MRDGFSKSLLFFYFFLILQLFQSVRVGLKFLEANSKSNPMNFGDTSSVGEICCR